MRLAFVALALIALGCGGPPPSAPAPAASGVVVRLRLPLDSAEASACDRECATRHAPGTTPFYECFGGCPGAEASDESTCGAADVRPKVACYMVEVIEDPTEPGLAPVERPPPPLGLGQGTISARTRSATGGPRGRPQMRPAPGSAAP